MTNPISNENNVTAIVLNIVSHRLFRPVGIKKDERDKHSFLKLPFADKGINVNKLGNILYYKSVDSEVPQYFKDQSIPIISYTYTTPIAAKIFSYTTVLQDLNIDHSMYMPPDWTCASSPFINNPSGHVVTGDLNITNNTCLQEVFAIGSKYYDAKFKNWKHSFNILIDALWEVV